jgi:transposase-like protein
MRKKYTATKKIEFCEEAILAKADGTPFNETSKKLGIANTSLHAWIIQYENGYLKHKQKMEIGLFQNEPEISKDLIEAVSEEINGVEMVDVLVFSKTTKCGILVSVERSKSNDIDEYRQKIINEIDWDFVGKGFKFQ